MRARSLACLQVKPQNILLNLRGECKVSDFGCVAELQETAWRTTILSELQPATLTPSPTPTLTLSPQRPSQPSPHPTPHPSSLTPSLTPHPSSLTPSLIPHPSALTPSLIPHPSSLTPSLIPYPSSLTPSLIPHPSSLTPSPPTHPPAGLLWKMRHFCRHRAVHVSGAHQRRRILLRFRHVIPTWLEPEPAGQGWAADVRSAQQSEPCARRDIGCSEVTYRQHRRSCPTHFCCLACLSPGVQLEPGPDAGGMCGGSLPLRKIRGLLGDPAGRGRILSSP